MEKAKVIRVIKTPGQSRERRKKNSTESLVRIVRASVLIRKGLFLSCLRESCHSDVHVPHSYSGSGCCVMLVMMMSAVLLSTHVVRMLDTLDAGSPSLDSVMVGAVFRTIKVK